MLRSKFRLALGLALALASATAPAVAGMSTTDWLIRVERMKKNPTDPQERLWVAVNVEKVNAAARKITISHQAIPSIAMPAMTMTFAVADTTHLAMLHTGDAVDIQVANQSGVVQIVDFRMQH